MSACPGLSLAGKAGGNSGEAVFFLSRPLLLDLFCKASGAAMGYHRAGFDVVGVDIEPQPRYPFTFVRADALRPPFDLAKFDAIHASPPCQFGTTMKARWKDRIYENLIPETRRILKESGLPFVIENVEGSRRHMVWPIMLCGTMFALETVDGNQLRRHRYFECSFPILEGMRCRHNRVSAIGVYGGGQHPLRRTRQPVTINPYGHSGGSSTRDGDQRFGVDARREAMGIEWMSGSELSQAIPPAYTEFIGRHLLLVLEPATGKS